MRNGAEEMRKVTWCLGKYSGAMKVRDFVVGKGGGGGEWVGEEGWRAGTLRAKLLFGLTTGGCSYTQRTVSVSSGSQSGQRGQKVPTAGRGVGGG